MGRSLKIPLLLLPLILAATDTTPRNSLKWDTSQRLHSLSRPQRQLDALVLHNMTTTRAIASLPIWMLQLPQLSLSTASLASGITISSSSTSSSRVIRRRNILATINLTPSPPPPIPPRLLAPHSPWSPRLSETILFIRAWLKSDSHPEIFMLRLPCTKLLCIFHPSFGPWSNSSSVFTSIFLACVFVKCLAPGRAVCFCPTCWSGPAFPLTHCRSLSFNLLSFLFMCWMIHLGSYIRAWFALYSHEVVGMYM